MIMRSFTAPEMIINTFNIAREYLAFRKRPYADRESIRAYQLRHLQKLVDFAYSNVPLYREKYDQAKIHPRDLRSLDDLQNFPSINKSDVLAAYPDMAIARGLDLQRCLISKSSGSTGQVLNVVHQADRLAVQGLAMNRLITLYGAYRPWHKLVYIYTSEYPARSLFGMYPMILIPTLMPAQQTITRLQTLHPTYLACYPSHLRAIATELGMHECRQLNLKAISVSSELSTQQERDDLAELFGCGVYDEYSTEELTHVAAQCQNKTYHIFEDIVYLEILASDSDRLMISGERGEVVGTYLHNYAMPFIRYRQGDFAEIDETTCICGWKFRSIRGIAGRKMDQFILPSGRVLTSGWLLDASYSFLLDVKADIREFRLIQETPTDIFIEIVPGDSYTKTMSNSIINRFLELAGESLSVQVRIVSEIKRSGGGKYHPIISHVTQRKRM
jgi:phenylacetate-CoA ligase